MNADEFASEHNGITLAEVDGYHGIGIDEKLLRIETAVAEMNERVCTLLHFVEDLIGAAKLAKETAPGMLRPMIPDVPELRN